MDRERSAGIVIAIGPRDARAARRLAAATGRDCVLVPGVAAARALLTRPRCHAVLLGAPAHFDLPALTELSRRTDVPLGIISGTRAADTEAHVTRTLARHTGAVRSICVDAIHRAAFSVDTARRRSRVYWRWGAAIGRGFRNPWDVAVICAHGSANHVNLESAVLCGLSDGQREFPSGRSGCWSRGRERRCKRAQAGQSVLYLSDLNARILALLTCCGFSLNRELYPSSASLVRAGEAGGAAAVFTTLSLWVPQRWEAQYVTEALTAGSSLGSITSVLNGYHYRRYGVRPYLTFGDPAISTGEQAAGAKAWHPYFPPPVRADERDLAIELAGRAGNRRSTPTAIAAFREAIVDLRGRMEGRLPVIAAWGRQVADDETSSLPIARLFGELNHAHGTAFGAVLQEWTFCQQAVLGAPWTSARLTAARRALVSAFTKCDRLTARFLKVTAFRLPVEEGFLAGLDCLERSDGPPCDRCGCGQIVERWGRDGIALYVRFDCPICGFRRIGPAKRPGPDVRLPRYVRGAATATLALPGRRASGGPARFWMVFRTKRGNRVFFSREGALKGSRIAMRVPFPASLPCDTQVAGWSICADLEVWYGRILCASLPGRTPRPAAEKKGQK